MPLATFLQKTPTLILAIISVLLAYQLALLTWTFVPQQKTALLWTPAPANNNSSTTQIDTQQLQQQHLFGKKAEQTEKPEEVVKPTLQSTDITNAPKTKLNLQLVGIVAATDPNYSSVIISQKGKQDSYFIDSKIEGTRALIAHIYQDRVILDVNGSLETLMLDGVDELDKQHQNNKNSNPVVQKNRSSRSTKKRPKTVNLDREELLSNPGKLTDYIRISPVRKDGQIAGYRVKPGKDKTIFEESGLKSGDLAVELNGIDLTDTQQAVTLMKEFPTMTDMTLSVERDGQLHELYFSIP
ncbi:type II secretion system protein GspC [Psychromonas marina]|uniref:Type II secretion system protein GspC n=1 Tax=Psychromonas marina TaxID=88364 RepID=A0ABQ6E078_9GAMM|nr:type II secretion system protein GspC [Psychromonas marina]GLS90620.1 type II secretion system protein GspC [Psychromonas marina]